MDERFDRFVAGLLVREGGFVDHTKDPGGATNWGISLRYLRRERPEVLAGLQLDVDGDGDVDADDIRRLPRETAIEVYRRCWWDRHGYVRLAEPLGEKVCDLSVNMGPYHAHVLLQRALGMIGKAVDGRVGPGTLGVAAKQDPEMVRGLVRELARTRYEELIAGNPDLAVFRNGWMARAAW